MVSYLSRLGIEPEKISGVNYWYLSPLRAERTASFKVNRNLNRWFDYGEGIGGNLIDFGILYQQCSVADFLRQFKVDLLVGRLKEHQAPSASERERESKIQILEVTGIQKPALLEYLTQRKIAADVARAFCHQVHYQLAGKNYYAIGFQNDSGGFELRNPYSKISSSPKDITSINRGATTVSVFEGFFDMLSYQSLYGSKTRPPENLVVLNSVAFFKRSLPFLETNQSIQLYLDQDQSGRLLTTRALALGDQYVDRSSLYSGFKDLNEYLLASQQPHAKLIAHQKGHQL
jgi:DNA primase